ncbi:LysM peptidoglycan-binding domain-containing protein [Actinomycetospora soli]|uniref:LysM peptidoglycan-binding domain-containing protein n=1 Tax=Actinomycetospora soli TaxID=2893887 RepID=UPI00272E3130|nr:LysM domain-containing protein [Actinomycetospora soli]
MNLARIVGLVVLVVLLVAVISEPANSAATVRSGGRALGEAGSSLGAFVSSVTSGWGSSSRASLATDEDGVGSYTVRPGDTLSSIAARYRVEVSTLADRNDLADADLIRPGQRLSVR